jgi:arginase
LKGKDLQFSLIGVPTNSAGKRDGVANAPAALRRAGFTEALGHFSDVRDEGDVTFSKPSARRDVESGIIAHDSLVSMIRVVRATVDRVLQSGRFPLVIGGDCPILLGCLAACKGTRTGLLFVDGHEDAYPAHKSPTGEAADMELGFALGLEVQEQIRKATGSMPLIDASKVCILGARDRKVLQKTGIRSLAGLVEYHDDTELLAGNIAALTNKVLWRLSSKTNKLWLHIDLDVLSTKSLPAVDYQQPGGLSWKQLEELARTAMFSGNVLGCNVTIYNPDLDPSSRFAKRIVKFLSAMLA